MTLIFCVDDNFGLMFNNRRQSRDSVVLEDIKNCFTNEKIIISSYSEKLFAEANVDYTVCENFADCNGICFVENTYTSDLLNLADEVILYHWGRTYPADAKLDTDLLGANFTLNESSAFKGTSHDEIKKERYIR